MLSRKSFLRLKRIAEADFQQFFQNTEETLLMFDDQDCERLRKLGLHFNFAHCLLILKTGRKD